MGWARKYKDILLDHESLWLEAASEDHTNVCNTVATKIREFQLERNMVDEEPNDLDAVSWIV